MSTVTQTLPVPRSGVLARAADYAQLIKLRVTSLVVMTAWCGYYLGALKAGSSPWSWNMVSTASNWPARARTNTVSDG